MTQKIMSDSRQDLIQAAYAATIDPERLDQFEILWESYMDNKLAEGGSQEVLNSNEINQHISVALNILSRVNHEQDHAVKAQKIVDSEYGLRFILRQDGYVIAANQTANTYLNDKRDLHSLDLDIAGKTKISDWVLETNASVDPKYLFAHVYWTAAAKKSCLFIVPLGSQVLSDGTDSQYFLVTDVDFHVSPEALPAISKTYNLSEAEADVAMHLANGQTPKEIAAERDVSIYTVRNQIQSILSKTESKTAPEMVKTITGMSSKFQAIQFEAETIRSEQIASEMILRPAGFVLPDGRYFRFFEQGHPAGLPVLMIPSLMYDVGLSRPSARRAVLQGLRFIIPMRAGYGESDPHPQTSAEAMVESTAHDLSALIDFLGLSSVLVMSGWASCYAQRLAIRFPEKVSGLLQLNSVPLWDERFLKTIRARHRNIVKTSIHAPQVVPYLARLGKALMDSGRGDVFARSLDKDRSVDLKALKDPDVMRAITHGFDEIAKQGVQTFARDMKTVHTNWINDTRNIRAPVTLLKGSEHNDIPRFAYDNYKSAIPHARFEIIKGGGSYLHLTHFPIVARELKALNLNRLTHGQ